MKAFIYNFGWPWLFHFTRRVFNLDLQKEIRPNGKIIYKWDKWTINP